jgi:hypothetical protein
MGKYDPLKAPNPAAWLAMDEGDRIMVVEKYHRREKISLPNHRLHAAIHAIVENQIAEGAVVPAKETLARLMAEGLDRHDAVHAIGMVLSEHMHKMLTGGKPAGDPNAEYAKNLLAMTAEKWLRSG